MSREECSVLRPIRPVKKRLTYKYVKLTTETKVVLSKIRRRHETYSQAITRLISTYCDLYYDMENECWKKEELDVLPRPYDFADVYRWVPDEPLFSKKS